jgi:hypothetical protein
MHDLSGDWSGLYRFPSHKQPVAFKASLSQTGEWLTGTIEEWVELGLPAKTRLTAMIVGQVRAAEVSFMKTYDRQVGGYDDVSYVGTVASGGLEIGGVWTIPGNWSGTFTMIRAAGEDETLRISQTQEV